MNDEFDAIALEAAYELRRARSLQPKTRLVRGHVRGCAAKQLTMDGHWETAWGPIAETLQRFKHGRSGTTKPYVVLGCNDPDCPAEIAIRLDAITALLPRW